MALHPSAIEQARRDINSAPHGMATYHARIWADILNTSVQRVFAMIKGNDGRKRKGTPIRPEYQEWTRIVFAIKKSPPDGAGEISTDQAVAIAVQWGKLPEAAIKVPPGTYDRIARDMKLNKKQRWVSRFQADRPNRLHHFDASSSKFLYITKKIGDNDFLLKIHRPGSGDYKNKPIPVDRLRPWYYGVVDDYSGRLYGKIFPAMGENSDHSLQVLCQAWAEMGIPDELLADQGALKRGLISKGLIERLGVKLPESMPYAKEAHGKIERPWRTGWQRFEKPFYVGNWEKWEMPLSELNRQYQIYLADDYNQFAHRFEKNITKMQAHSRISLYGGIVKIPEDAIATVARREERTIGPDGILRLDGQMWESKHLHSAKVIVFIGIYKDRKDYIVVQDIKTGKKYDDIELFAPNNVGEFKSHADTPHQTLIKEYTPQLIGTAPMLYSDKKPKNEKIISMPIKTKEEREIEDPFDVDTYPSIREAMNDFMGYLPGVFLKPEDREVIEKQVEANGLSKKFVENFALEVRAQMMKRQAM